MTDATIRQPRRRFCSECGAIEVATNGVCPVGWLQVAKKAPEGARFPFDRLGVFCSARCLTLASPRIEAAEELAEDG